MADYMFERLQDVLSIAGNIAELIGLGILIRSLRPPSDKQSIREKERSF